MLRMIRRTQAVPATLVLSLLLTACGGEPGSSGGIRLNTGLPISASVGSGTPAPAPGTEPNAPNASGDTAADGVNWFNFRRQQMGLSPFVRNATIDAAAQGHSAYQARNNVSTHAQTAGLPGFTGIRQFDRLTAAGYRFTQQSYAFGEVIAGTPDRSGVNAAEDLIAAIYHRFVIFEPMFKEIGAGAATVANGNTYFTANVLANGLTTGVGTAAVAVYPYAGQMRVARNFFSDNEEPDPVPGRNEVGYPISVHADITATVTVQTFTVRPRGGNPLQVQLLTSETDAKTPPSAAAIIPVNVLAAGATYDVQFAGAVNGQPVTRNWSFTTQ